MLTARNRRLKYQGKIDDTRCSICWEQSHKCTRRKKNCVCTTTLHDRQNKRVCKHSFCFKCIDKWSEEKNTCPLCRAPFHRLICIRRTKNVFSKDKYFSMVIDCLMNSVELRLRFVMDVYEKVPSALYMWSLIDPFVAHLEETANHVGIPFSEEFPEFYNMVELLRQF